MGREVPSLQMNAELLKSLSSRSEQTLSCGQGLGSLVATSSTIVRFLALRRLPAANINPVCGVRCVSCQAVAISGSKGNQKVLMFSLRIGLKE